jgi:probable rRNA maturation factor
LRKAEISILLVDNHAITLLNRKYFAKNRPTDVIAFPQDWEGPSPSGKAYNLGDVVISTEQASIQAKTYGTTFATELKLLIAHGILHLVGYDDINPKDRDKMREMEKLMLEKTG